MKSKYLNEIGCEYKSYFDDDERKEIFEKEREEYGLASCETWNLDITFFEFLYISFMMYNEVNIVNKLSDLNYNAQITQVNISKGQLLQKGIKLESQNPMTIISVKKR